MDPQTTFDSDTILRKIACTWLFWKPATSFNSFIITVQHVITKLLRPNINVVD